MKLKSIFALALVCVSVFFLTACKEETIAVEDVTGMNAEEAVNKLNDAGFTDVTLTADASSESSMVLDSSNWTVTSQSPEAGSKETKDVKIDLQCKKTNEIEQEQLDKLINLPLPDAQNKLSELGYTATFFHQDSDLEITADLSVYTEDELSKWIVTDIKSFDIDNKTIEIVVNTKENVAANEANKNMLNTLQNKLGASYAWQTVEKYGEDQYPYGFELHYIMGKLAEEALDENTWFLKASATVTNAVGTEAEMTCEAKVSGTNEAPQIVDFIVY
ncbi:MAG TPA: PASTA domain-containing protein [Candidatus Mediterraneibacter surreyensis]|nr:PASTA domain-containing protein [Candidatus Mediterraneibacter surreyensis]